jgi:hypothetical protein
MSNNTTNIQSLTASEVLSKFFASKGQFIRAAWKSNPSPAKAHKGTILEKRTTTIVRSGLSFANLSSVKAGIESGERPEVGPLPFGEWVIPNYLIKLEKPESVNYYLRMYPTGAVPMVKYYVNGDETTKEHFASFLTPSEAKKLLGEKDAPECFTIKLENVLSTEDVING